MDKKKKLDPKDFKMISWDKLPDELKEKAKKQTFTCMLCGEDHTGMKHKCGE